MKSHPAAGAVMADTRTLAPRPERSATTVGLLLGDVALITLFVVLGEFRHHDPGMVPAQTPGTLVPFLVGWAVAALLAGVYARHVRTDVRAAVGRTALAWTGAVAVGQGLRATAAFPGDASPAFVAVSLAVGLVLLLPWRAVAASRLA